MQDTLTQYDHALRNLDDLLTDLRRRNPEKLPEVHRVEELGPPTPAAVVRGILLLFTVAAGALLVQAFLAISFYPDEEVFVIRQGNRFQVWPDVQAYEAATGESWVRAPVGASELRATFYHGRRHRAMQLLPFYLGILGLCGLGLYYARMLEPARAAAAHGHGDGHHGH